MATIVVNNLGWIIVLFVVAVAMISQAFLLAWIYNKRRQNQQQKDNADNNEK